MELHIQLMICQIILYLLKNKLHFESKISLSSVLSVPSPFNRYSYFFQITLLLEEQKDALEDSKKELEELYDAVQWFYDKQIDGIDDFIDKLNDANDVLEKQKDKYDNILSAIDNVYGDEIVAIQAKIDAMDKANDAAERELALEKAKQALEEARNRRAIKVKYMPLFTVM